MTGKCEACTAECGPAPLFFEIAECRDDGDRECSFCNQETCVEV